MRVLCSLILLVTLGVGGRLAAQNRMLDIAGYVPQEKHLAVGTQTPIKATSGVLSSLKVIYRPGSAVEKTVDLEVVNGSAQWTPEFAGLARLQATITPADGGEPKDYREVVPVRFASFVSLGLFVMVIAGVILFGGAFVSIRALLRTDAGSDG